MKNKQKGFANVLIIILVIVLVGVVGYMTLIKKSPITESLQTNSVQNSEETVTTPNPRVEQNNVVSTRSEILVPGQQVVIKKGLSHIIKWQGQNKIGTGYIYLVWYSGAHTEEVTKIGQFQFSVGTYVWNVPTDLKPSSGTIIIKERDDLYADVIGTTDVTFVGM